jgi:hypothetical protein
VWNYVDTALTKASTPTALFAVSIGLTGAVLALVVAIATTPIRFADYDIILSALAAITSAAYAGAVRLRADARDRTFNFIEEHRNNPDIVRALNVFMAFAAKNKALLERGPLPDEVAVNLLRDPEAAAVRDAIRVAANFFEEMAVAIEFGEVLDAMLFEYEAEMFVRFFEGLAPLLPAIRNAPPLPGSPYGEVERPTAFRHCEALFERWQPRLTNS